LQKYDSTYNKNTTNQIDRQPLFLFKDKHLTGSGKATNDLRMDALKHDRPTQKANTATPPTQFL
jgi:hypothetical protein